jgi:cytidine deaminase
MAVPERLVVGIEPPGDERTLTVLRERAFAAMERAYAPYSNFRVGAALLASDGSISEGCNVENAAFPAGICAERGAVAAAVARGNRSFETMLVATEADDPTPPCGMCRQVLEEFSPHLLVVSVTRGGREARWTLDELLPKAFTPHSLGRR